MVPGDSVEPDDPSLLELASATMRALVNTYPEARLLVFDMPEHRIWAAAYERAWRSLDERYGIEAICNLASVLESASQRTGYPGGSQRAIQEVRGDIVNLYFWDCLVSDGRILERAGRPNVGVVWSSLAEELFPILRAISQPGWETLNFIDYTPSNIVRRPGALANGPERYPAGDAHIHASRRQRGTATAANPEFPAYAHSRTAPPQLGGIFNSILATSRSRRFSFIHSSSGVGR